VHAFLSPGWINALAVRLEAGGAGSSPVPLTVQYEISTRDGIVDYYVRLGPEGDTAAAGTTPDADVTFRMDEATAGAIADGTLSSEEAFITGRLDLEGDTAAVIDAHRASGDA